MHGSSVGDKKGTGEALLDKPCDECGHCWREFGPGLGHHAARRHGAERIEAEADVDRGGAKPLRLHVTGDDAGGRFAINATTGVVTDGMYATLAETYVLGKVNSDFLRHANPWALRSMVEKLSEAADRGLWAEPDPQLLAELQAVIERTYGARDRARGVPATVAWLAEELGELAQAVRKGTLAEQRHELGDVLAWLASLAHQLDVPLDEAAQRYADGCPRCSSLPCACP